MNVSVGSHQSFTLPKSKSAIDMEPGRSREFHKFWGESFQVIKEVDRLPPFFMALVSADDHWMFVASNGAMTCGRRNADRTLFPYYCSDKLLDLCSSSGSMTIVQCTVNGNLVNWQPWTGSHSQFEIHRSLYKNKLSSRIGFEERNQTLGMTFRCQWAFSRRYGFIRRCQLINTGFQHQSLRILDGLINVMPGELDQQFQLRFSNLADAYKKSELHADGQMGVYYLSSIPTDRAEPNEGLRASIVWHDLGKQSPVLLSERQLNQFRIGAEIKTETDARGQRGAMLTVRRLDLEPGSEASWNVVADVHQDHADFTHLRRELSENRAWASILDHEMDNHDQIILQLASQVDSLQVSGQANRADRHLSNCLFNTMRGGIPLNGYWVDRQSLVNHVQQLNHQVWSRNKLWFGGLPVQIHYLELQEKIKTLGDPDLVRICGEYLPLTFSRRHGDPTRPWNAFNIDTKHSDGTPKLHYEGNWRDIFQNWEAMATSFPLLLPAMIRRFVNASTVDGYNPYRLTMSGFEWERLDPSDSWANIGYWGDHQIVYLLKLLERCGEHLPKILDGALAEPTCVYAEVPYRIRDYASIRANPRETVDYIPEIEQAITVREAEIGGDGRLVIDQHGQLHRVTLLEKLLLTASIKMTNWIPDAGIWLNTQRPEWNDAQNALVGNGASVITVCHLVKYLNFLRKWLGRISDSQFQVSEEVADLLGSLADCLRDVPPESGSRHCFDAAGRPGEDSTWSAQQRHAIAEQLQRIGEEYRRRVYSGFSGGRSIVELHKIDDFLDCCIRHLARTVRANRREDGLYHAYNLLDFGSDFLEIERLDEMLEGQVAVIESGLLETGELVELLEALRGSSLYRPDQHSYLLYPDRRLPRFDERNRVESGLAQAIPEVNRIVGQRLSQIIYRDADGCYRFSADLHNAKDLQKKLDKLRTSTDGKSSGGETEQIQTALPSDDITMPPGDADLLKLYEATFRHRHFSGRSNTFFAYEGLGSIYWHMVSKLCLAVCRQCIEAEQRGDPVSEQLRAFFRETNDGIWFTKNAAAYGAFPTDPYSHTPRHVGVQQPGMTGQVKEDILIRQLELGLRVVNGQIQFNPWLVDDQEWLEAAGEFYFFDLDGVWQSFGVALQCFAFTVCQVPVVVRKGCRREVRVFVGKEKVIDRPQCELTYDESQSIFRREGRISKIEVQWDTQ